MLPPSGIRHNQKLDWIQAAVWSNDIPESFFLRDADYQNEIVAAYLISKREEAVVADEVRRNNNNGARS